jgi:hypothetical protein
MLMPAVPGFLRRPTFWIAAAVALAAYTVAGFWLVPRLVVSNLHGVIHDRYRREVRVGDVSFNPFTLQLVVRKFALPDADGSALVSFDRLTVRLGVMSIFRLAPDFKLVALEAPSVRVVRRADGRVNLLDLVPPTNPKADPNAPPPRVWIDELSIRDGTATVSDQKRSTPLTLAFHPISITLHAFSTRSEGNAYTLAATSLRGEGFEWRGTFGLAPVASQGSFTLNVHAATLADILAGQLPFDLSSGELSLKGGYALVEHGERLALEAQLAELVVKTLGIRAHGDEHDAVQIPRLTVSGTRFDLDAQSVSVEHVALEQPKVNAVRGADGQLSLLRLLPAAASDAGAAPPPAPAPPAAAATAAKPWMIAVPDIRISGADVTLEDHAPRSVATFHFAPIDLVVSGYASPATKPLGVDFKATVNDTGQLSSNGTLTLEPLGAQLNVSGATLPLTALQPYVDGVTALVIGAGTAGFSGTVALASSDGVSAQFDGSVSVDGLETKDRGLQQDFIKWRSLQMTGARVRTAPLAVRIREITVHGPYARVVIGPNSISNIREVLNPRGAAAIVAAASEAKTAAVAPEAVKSPPPAPVPGRALPVEIATVRIDGGSVNFADLSIKPNFATGIQQLAGTVTGLSGRADSRADVDLKGQVDEYSPVTIAGKVNYLSPVNHLDLKVTFRNMELTSLSPYSGHFAGYTIERGKMSADLNYRVEGRQLDGQHKLTINQLQLGERVDSPDATDLPVKLAIALLKDRNGVIDLDLAVSGSLDDPKFSIGPLIWKVVVGVIEKAVMAPFKLLGALFGGGEELSFVDFAPGSAALDEANQAKLKTLVKALDARPALNVDVPLASQPDGDGPALAAAHWRDDLATRARARLASHANEPGAVERLLATPKEYRALLEDAYRDAFGHRADIPKPAAEAAAGQEPSAQAIGWLEGELKGRISVGQDELAALAQARANGVQALLVTGTGIEPARVFVINVAPLPAAATVRMQLALH